MISVGFKTDKGRQRGGNEDAIFVLPKEKMYIVADGVGGHNSGELASRLAVGYVAQYVALHPLTGQEGTSQLRKYFESCLMGANDLIYKKSQGSGVNAGMATTLVLAYLREGEAFVVNVGDSRAYLIRGSGIRQITEDHTCVQTLINAGALSPDQAVHHPDRNMITRALGGEPDIVPDFFRFDILPRDILLLCSDGLHGEVDAEDIFKLSKKAGTMHRLATDLVEEANSQGGKDNISVICIKIQ